MSATAATIPLTHTPGGMLISVVLVACLGLQSPTKNCGKVVNSCQHPNVRDFLECLESLGFALDLVHDT
jgi:hypothetical protein